ncbi:MAG: hypothetical protein GEU81_17310 [Nitriliruptorales bacterium]|nr:hypothetical protein [Nitriliruptorales bacterium]
MAQRPSRPRRDRPAWPARPRRPSWRAPGAPRRTPAWPASVSQRRAPSPSARNRPPSAACRLWTTPHAGDAVIDRTGECDSIEHTERGYDNPDYDDFWLERDYRKDAASFRAAALIAHGWQDYNVKQEEGVKL